MRVFFFIILLFIYAKSFSQANAGADQVINMPTTQVTLVGSGGTTYAWTKISGGQYSQEGNIVSPSSATTVVNQIGIGVYRFELSVNGGTSRDTVTVTGLQQKSPACNVTTFKKVTLTQTSPGELYYPNAAALNLLGGDTLVIPAGTWNLLQLGTSGDPTKGIIGDSCHRIEIRMGNGTTDVVNFVSNGTSPLMRFYSARYVNLRGNWKLFFTGATGIGIAFTDASSDYTVEKWTVNGLDNAVLSKKDIDTNNPASYYPNWFFKNAVYQNFSIKKTNGESFYLGHTFTPFVSGYRPVSYNGLTVQYGSVDSSGWDGIQTSCALNTLIQYDTINHTGLGNVSSQQFGAILGGFGYGTIRNCIISNTASSAIAVFSIDTANVINNTITSCGVGIVDGNFTSVYVNDNIVPGLPTPTPGLLLIFQNNCIVNPAPYLGNYTAGAAIQNRKSNGTTRPGVISNNTISDALGRTLSSLIYDDGSGDNVSNNVLGSCNAVANPYGGKNYYFSTATGDDTRNSVTAQNPSTPWKTVSKLSQFFSSLQAGDQALFNRGEVFPATALVVNKSGTSGVPITIGAYGTGAKPVISGMTTVAAWTNLGSNIWESTSAVSTLSALNIVIENGTNTGMGRTPNSGWYTIDSHSGSTQITSTSIGSPNWTGAEVVIRKNHFVIDRGTITNQSGSTITYSSSGTDDAQNGYGFFIQNDVRTLDAQGEWYYNPSTKKLRIYSTSAPVNVQVPTIDRVIEMTNQNNLTFSNIYWNGSNNETFYIGSCSNVNINNCDFVFSGKNCIWGGNNFGSASSNFKLESCTINNTNNNALTMANEFVNPIVRLNTVTNTALIVGAGVSGTQGSRGIYSFGVDGMLVELNRYDSVGYIPVEFSGTNSIVQKNYISNYCLNKDDGAGIYAYQDADLGKKILDNIILNGVGNGSGTADGLSAASAIYMDDDCANVEIARNTGANCALMGLFLHNAKNINVHDNTFYNNEIVFGTLGAQAALISDGSAGAITGITMVNNKMISRTAAQYVATYSDVNTGIPGFFTTLNNNYYARPIDDNLTIHTLQNSYGTENYLTLTQWKTFSGLDALSKKSPATVTTVNDIVFYTNPTGANVVQSLNGTYIDVTGQTYVGSITLLPYTSAVLIFQSGGGVQPLSVNASFTTISCNGNLSTITAIATGGVTPYSFKLDGGSPQVGNTWTNQSAGTHTIQVTDQQGTVASTTFTITQPTQISISESHTAITVNGNTSTVTITASGGTGTKTYKIGSGSYQSSNQFTGVIAGTYTVTVRDANLCTNTITFTITQPSVLVVGSSVTTAITCNAGTGVITVTASGGTPPYTNTGTFTRAAGTWSFTVTDAGGASATTTTTITQPTAIIISESHTAIAINGGTSTVTITASGGTGTLNYKIGSGSYQSSNVFSGVVAGTYTVTVRDASLCTNTITFTITQPTALLVSAAVTTAIACNNGTGTATVTASGGTSPYQYKVGAGSYGSSAIFSGLVAGTYTFTVLDAGGAIVSTVPLTITQPAVISVSSAYGTAPATVTVTASGGVGTLNYRIDIGSYQASNVFTGVAAGNHIITVRDANLCTATQTINVPAAGTPLGISSSPTTNATCNGGNGSITISGSGGTPPYTGTGVFARAAGTWSFTITDNVGATASTTVTITQPAPVSASISYSPIAVNGGTTTVTFTGSGGVPAYTYSLDGSGYQAGAFAGVLAGNHTVIVKDANTCTTTLLFTITQPGALYISVSPTAITFYGGTSTVTISGSGGTAPVTVTGGSPQTKSAGTYTFSVVDALEAQKDTIVTITQPPQITISVVTGTIVTNGGNTTVTVTASGGTGTLTYSLDGGSYQGTGNFAGVLAGTHTVTVKDAVNYTNTNTFSISQPGALFISATPTLSSLVCYGNTTTVTVTASGGTPTITYGKNGVFQGSGTFNTVAAGTYTFSVKDAFNAQHDTLLTITQPTQISILQYLYSPITVYGGTTTIDVKANGGTGALQYKLDGGSYQVDTLFAGVSAGVHTVYVRDASLCVNSQSFTIASPPPSPQSYYLRKRGVKHKYVNE